jgi:streptogramin lyase
VTGAGLHTAEPSLTRILEEAVFVRVPARVFAVAFLVAAAACGSTSPASPPPVTPTESTPEAPPTPNPPPTPDPTITPDPTTPTDRTVFREYAVPPGSSPHDVAPAPDGRVWYTAQGSGELGVVDPDGGRTRHVSLGEGSAPHGVIVGPDGAPWITDGGLNAIVRVDPESLEVSAFPLPRPDYANLNTAAFDGEGLLWFTGQTGVYGSVDPGSGRVRVFDAPRGEGPYGITSTPDGTTSPRSPAAT